MDTDEPILTMAMLASAATLDRGSESVRAVMTSEENRFSRALADLQRLALGEQIPIAIVGGLGAIRYGYPAATQDIDIAIAHSQLDELLEVAPCYGFTNRSKVAADALCQGDVEINVVAEGGKARNTAPTTIPGPVQLGVPKGLDYASLPGWIELKLSSARQKDRAHIVEVMKKTAAEPLQQARDHIAAVHVTYLQLFDQLQAEAREELEQEDGRGH